MGSGGGDGDGDDVGTEGPLLIFLETQAVVLR